MINDIETIFNKYQNTMNKYSIPLIKISYKFTNFAPILAIRFYFI